MGEFVGRTMTNPQPTANTQTGADTPSYRWERINRLLHELQYEVTRGMMEREIDEEIGFRFYVPISNKIPDGIVACEFRTRPVPRGYWSPDDVGVEPRLKIVGKSEERTSDE